MTTGRRLPGMMAGNQMVMGEDGGSVEVLRRRFRNGEPAQTLRHAARAVLVDSTAAGPEPEWVDDVLVVISELVQNVTQHTRSPGELVVSVASGMITIEVGDADSTVPRARRPHLSQAGGRGLLLIDAISHHWGVRSCPGGKSVWARLTVTPDPPGVRDRSEIDDADGVECRVGRVG
ncbi:ATP-binding protein [Actinoplanes sp. LDG1-06]|uniref:ATP-binding protein n=1 Tax=Paractinoplanes ovalisporus TaxID=2810368 RepID=A0ABS2ALZ2_9ACTN|nr:ATP-binding protein [Actinoplanes ovalisporus]MBM2620882.1 ATP-binding protein [Actinoplanes ovalisporus]